MCIYSLCVCHVSQNSAYYLSSLLYWFIYKSSCSAVVYLCLSCRNSLAGLHLSNHSLALSHHAVGICQECFLLQNKLDLAFDLIQYVDFCRIITKKHYIQKIGKKQLLSRSNFLAMATLEKSLGSQSHWTSDTLWALSDPSNLQPNLQAGRPYSI